MTEHRAAPALIAAALLGVGILCVGHFASAADNVQHPHHHNDGGNFLWRSEQRALELSHRDRGIAVDYARDAPLRGVQTGDTIVAVGGHPVNRIADLQQWLRALHGAPARLSLHGADGSRRQLRVTAADYTALLPPLPAAPAAPAPPTPSSR